MTLLERFELLQRQRVDRPHPLELSFEVAHSGFGCHLALDRGQPGGHGCLGLGVELAAEGVGQRLQLDPLK